MILEKKDHRDSEDPKGKSGKLVLKEVLGELDPKEILECLAEMEKTEHLGWMARRVMLDDME